MAPKSIHYGHYANLVELPNGDLEVQANPYLQEELPPEAHSEEALAAILEDHGADVATSEVKAETSPAIPVYLVFVAGKNWLAPKNTLQRLASAGSTRMYPYAQHGRSKKALDAMLEELSRGTDYPGTDKEYEHPFGSKGTETENVKYGSSTLPSQKSVEEMKWLLDWFEGNMFRVVKPHSDPRLEQPDAERVNEARPAMKKGYEDLKAVYDTWNSGDVKAAAELVMKNDVGLQPGTLDEMYEQLKSVDPAFATEFGTIYHREPKPRKRRKAQESYAARFHRELKHALGQDDDMKTADVEMHETPKFLPPRDDMRRHIDEENKPADVDEPKKIAGYDTNMAKILQPYGFVYTARYATGEDRWSRGRDAYIMTDGKTFQLFKDGDLQAGGPISILEQVLGRLLPGAAPTAPAPGLAPAMASKRKKANTCSVGMMKQWLSQVKDELPISFSYNGQEFDIEESWPTPQGFNITLIPR